MAEAIAVPLSMQIAGQLLFEFPILFKRILKLMKKLRRADKEAHHFIKDCRHQYRIISQIIREIRSRFPYASNEWIAIVDDIGQQAKYLIDSIFHKIIDVLKKRGYTWRVKWAIVNGNCKKGYAKLVELGKTLTMIENGIRLAEENSQATNQEQKNPVADGIKAGAVCGIVVGAGIGFCIADAALKGAAIGGLAGLVVGACFGAFVGWRCS